MNARYSEQRWLNVHLPAVPNLKRDLTEVNVLNDHRKTSSQYLSARPIYRSADITACCRPRCLLRVPFVASGLKTRA